MLNGKWMGTTGAGLGLWLVLLIVLIGSGKAQAGEPILVVADEGRGSHQQLIKAIRNHLADGRESGLSLKIVATDRLSELIDSGAYTKTPLMVTVGANAARVAVKQLPQRETPPVLHTLLPRATYQNLYGRTEGKPAGNRSALFLDQPTSRRMRLLQLALPEYKRIGVLLGPWSSWMQDELLATLPQGWEMRVEQIEESAQVIPNLRRLLSECDLLFAVADNRVYNRSSVQGVLLTTYRHRIPVLGFSRNYVKAGALLAVYSTPAQLGRHTGEIIVRAVYGKAGLPPPMFSKYYSVATNSQVGRSLGIELERGKRLEQRLKRLEDGE